MRDIGKNIRDLRVRGGMTQEELAGKLFVTRQTVSNYETGKTRPDLDLLIKIAELLDTDANTLLYGVPRLPIPERRKKSILLSSGLLLVLLLLSVILHPWCDSLFRTKYIALPHYLLAQIFDPIFMLILGWWSVHLISFFLRITPLQQSWVKKLRVAFLSLLGLIGVLLLPYCVWFALATFGYTSSGFPPIPIYRPLLTVILKLNFHYEAIYALFGAILYLLGFPGEPKKKDNKVMP